MGKVIHSIPGELLDDILRGECVPVIGAGFSLNAILPPGCRMPLWNDLGALAAERMNCKSTESALRDLSRYCSDMSKFELIALLWDALHIRTAKPGPAHIEFAKLPFKHVVTTNFDFLLERAYYLCGKSCLPIVDEDLFAFGRANGDTRLIKMHGDVHHPSLMIVTEEDYDGFRDQRSYMFHAIAHLLIHNTVLFIGYSIDDPDFRQIWELIKKQFGQFRRSAYVLLVEGTKEIIDDYQRRGVTRVISLPGNVATYGVVLQEAFEMIGREIGIRSGYGKGSNSHKV